MDLLYYLRNTLAVLILALASYEDIRTKTISNRLIAVGTIGGCVLAGISLNTSTILDALLGLLAGGGIFLFIACISRGGIGMGDVKLMACTGICLGLGRTLSVLMLAIIISGITAAVFLLIKIVDKKGTIPFAPFILLGTLSMFILHI